MTISVEGYLANLDGVSTYSCLYKSECHMMASALQTHDILFCTSCHLHENCTILYHGRGHVYSAPDASIIGIFDKVWTIYSNCWFRIFIVLLLT